MMNINHGMKNKIYSVKVKKIFCLKRIFSKGKMNKTASLVFLDDNRKRYDSVLINRTSDIKILHYSQNVKSQRLGALNI